MDENQHINTLANASKPSIFKHPLSSSSMLGSIDDSDGEDQQKSFGRPTKKIQLCQISRLINKYEKLDDQLQAALPELADAQAAGQYGYILPIAWYEAWEDYCTFPQSKLSPGPISLSILLDVDNQEEDGPIFSSQAGGQATAAKPPTLKEGLVQNRDYLVVPTEAWNLLGEWYGIEDDSCVLMVSPGAGSNVADGQAVVLSQQGATGLCSVISPDQLNDPAANSGYATPTLSSQSATRCAINYRLGPNFPIRQTTVERGCKVAELYGTLVRLALIYQSEQLKEHQQTDTEDEDIETRGIIECEENRFRSFNPDAWKLVKPQVPISPPSNIHQEGLSLEQESDQELFIKHSQSASTWLASEIGEKSAMEAGFLDEHVIFILDPAGYELTCSQGISGSTNNGSFKPTQYNSSQATVESSPASKRTKLEL